MLAGAGVPILKALQAAAETLGNRAMRADAMDALVQVREGAPLASALAGKKRFPGLLAMFARLGEQTGQLPVMLAPRRVAAVGRGAAPRDGGGHHPGAAADRRRWAWWCWSSCWRCCCRSSSSTPGSSRPGRCNERNTAGRAAEAGLKRPAGIVAARHTATPRTPAMTPEQISLVRSSFARVVPVARSTATLFYANLFEAQPALRALFKGDMDDQGAKLLQMIGAAVGLLDKPQTLLPVLRQLGARHGGYGVQPAHYDAVGAALLKTLAPRSGPALRRRHARSLDHDVHAGRDHHDRRRRAGRRRVDAAAAGTGRRHRLNAAAFRPPARPAPRPAGRRARRVCPGWRSASRAGTPAPAATRCRR